MISIFLKGLACIHIYESFPYLEKYTGCRFFLFRDNFGKRLVSLSIQITNHKTLQKALFGKQQFLPIKQLFSVDTCVHCKTSCQRILKHSRPDPLHKIFPNKTLNFLKYLLSRVEYFAVRSCNHLWGYQSFDI